MKTRFMRDKAAFLVHIALLVAALAPGLVRAAAPQDGTVDTPPNAGQGYYYLDPAAPLPREAGQGKPITVPPQGKPDKNNHLPVKPVPGPRVDAGHYRLTPLPF